MQARPCEFGPCSVQNAEMAQLMQNNAFLKEQLNAETERRKAAQAVYVLRARVVPRCCARIPLCACSLPPAVVLIVMR